MKINRLETHDRLQHFVSGGFNISETCQSLIDRRPFGDHPFYIFAHKRELGMDERFSYWLQYGAGRSLAEVPTARFIWQPRLTKPEAQENSMLFKGYPGTDLVRIIWMIPQRELWEQYEKGKMTENSTIVESIHNFLHNKEKLEAKEPEDLPDEAIQRIYDEIRKEAVKKHGKSS